MRAQYFKDQKMNSLTSRNPVKTKAGNRATHIEWEQKRFSFPEVDDLTSQQEKAIEFYSAQAVIFQVFWIFHQVHENSSFKFHDW